MKFGFGSATTRVQFGSIPISVCSAAMWSVVCSYMAYNQWVKRAVPLIEVRSTLPACLRDLRQQVVPRRSDGRLHRRLQLPRDRRSSCVVLTQCYASLPTPFLLPAAGHNTAHWFWQQQPGSWCARKREVLLVADDDGGTCYARKSMYAIQQEFCFIGAPPLVDDVYSKLSSACSLWHGYCWATYCTIQSFSASSTSTVVQE